MLLREPGYSGRGPQPTLELEAPKGGVSNVWVAVNEGGARAVVPRSPKATAWRTADFSAECEEGEDGCMRWYKVRALRGVSQLPGAAAGAPTAHPTCPAAAGLCLPGPSASPAAPPARPACLRTPADRPDHRVQVRSWRQEELSGSLRVQLPFLTFLMPCFVIRDLSAPPICCCCLRSCACHLRPIWAV